MFVRSPTHGGDLSSRASRSGDGPTIPPATTPTATSTTTGNLVEHAEIAARLHGSQLSFVAEALGRSRCAYRAGTGRQQATLSPRPAWPPAGSRCCRPDR